MKVGDVRHSKYLIAGAVLASACTPGEGSLPAGFPPLEFESKHALIGIDPALGYPLCAGDLERIDRVIESAEIRTGRRGGAPVDVYIVPWDLTEELCGEDGLVGCYRADHVVSATWQSLDHELVHSVTRDVDFPSSFWKEGAVQMLSHRTFKSRFPIDESIFETEVARNYVSASHFARFLVESRGWEKYLTIIDGGSIQGVYGVSESAIAQEYEENVPAVYPSLDPCPYPGLPQTEPGVWHETLEFSCETAGTTQAEILEASLGPGAAVLRTINIEAGVYSFEMQGGDLFAAIGCATEVLWEEPVWPSSGDLPNQAEGSYPERLASGESHTLELTAGKYLISISSGSNELTSVGMTVTRLD